jgi:hypothetical protein
LISKSLNKSVLAKVGYESFLKNTPIHKGNAKSKTKLNGNQINAAYNYATVLNQGRGQRDGQMRGSVQAPVGMTEPMIKDIRQYIFTKTNTKLIGNIRVLGK